MLRVEELNKSKEIFDGIFSRVEIAIETKDYFNYPHVEYITYVIVIDSKIDMIDRKIKATAKFIKGNIPVEFRIGFMFSEETIIQQDIHEIVEKPLFAVEADRLFTDNDWLATYRSWLIEAVQTNIKTVTLETKSGQFKAHNFSVRDIYML
ncbi:hypothetical protein [Ornithinibacillus scapharcae]|uniref:hypothetical protein n=1 Tax=Ornithinibacillus scapharcae TaxID=1147159 RepID=UPI000225B9C9|nr:hypothetical protein [Ornithinibacillus scapharcae]